MDLANKNRPKFFKDYITSQGSSSNLTDVLKQLIARNLHAKVRKLWLTAPPGVGKTTAALLYARATLCHNRPEGEYEPCGECPVCTGEDVSNIFHYTITSPSEAREPIRQLIERSYSAPVSISTRADQYRQFIIIDEFELASPELAAMLLDPLEFSPETTTWIIISMDPEKLERRDPVTKEAIDSRCAWFPLGRLTEEQIAEALVTNIDTLDYDAALAIAQLSEGNMRKAWNTLEFFLTVNEAENLTADDILLARTGGATPSSRESMWRALEEGNGLRVKEIFTSWLNKAPDAKAIAKLLEQDLLHFLDAPNTEIQQLLAALGRWYTSSHPYPLVSVFMSHLGNVVLFPAERARLRAVKPADPVEVVTAEVRVKTSAAEQLLKAQAATVGIPKIFLCKDYKEILAAYTGDMEAMEQARQANQG